MILIVVALICSPAAASAQDVFEGVFKPRLSDVQLQPLDVAASALACSDVSASGDPIGQKGEPTDPPQATVAQDDDSKKESVRDCPGAHHTGFGALVRTTGADFRAFPRRRSTWVILGIGAAAALLVHPGDTEFNSHVVSSDAVGKFFSLGKWLGSAPVEAGAAIGLYAIGRYIVPRNEGEHIDSPRTNKVSHLGFDLLRAQIVSQAIIQTTKIAVRRDRPTGECCSFPSGHAASAFAAASVIERHLGYRAAWPTLLAATYVGMSRLHDNRHFVSDVMFGSAIGIATGWTIVGRHGRSDYALAPVPVRGGLALALSKVY
jgi:membrane-associated phospholipid phosphatase